MYLYNALTIANYIVEYCNARRYSMSNLKLQKVLYFVQANFLVSTLNHRPCFTNRIEAWDFGPVVPDVYHHYKMFGVGDIPIMSDDFLSRYFGGINEYITQSDKEMIDEVIEYTRDYTASDLVQLTHNQAPWKKAYDRYWDREIRNKELLEYFMENE